MEVKPITTHLGRAVGRRPAGVCRRRPGCCQQLLLPLLLPLLLQSCRRQLGGLLLRCWRQCRRRQGLGLADAQPCEWVLVGAALVTIVTPVALQLCKRDLITVSEAHDCGQLDILQHTRQ